MKKNIPKSATWHCFSDAKLDLYYYLNIIQSVLPNLKLLGKLLYDNLVSTSYRIS